MTQFSYREQFTREALQTTFVLKDTFAIHVLQSQCAAQYSDIMEAAKIAFEALTELHQVIQSKLPWHVGAPHEINLSDLDFPSSLPA